MTESRTVWQARINALTDAIHETHQLIDVIGKERMRDMELFLSGTHDENEAYELMLLVLQTGISVKLLQSLEAFFKEAAGFFLDNFFGDGEALLDEDDLLRHRYIMRVLLYQVSLDLNMIQQAVNQRRSLEFHKPEQVDLMLSLQNQSVTMADSVATMALDPLIHAGYLPENTNVLCYLGKNIRARLVPYDDTLLIRVAADAAQINHYMSAKAGGGHSRSLSGSPSRDLLALLHEVGHHLYWNGRYQTSFIYQTLTQKTKEMGIYHPREWRRRWMEEIFADAFALMLGGPAVVLDFQEMLSDDLPNHFKEDTDKHPIPELRPLIQTQLLRKFKDENGQPLFTKMPDELDAQWQTLIESNPLTQPFRIHSRQPESGAAILQALDGMLDVIVDLLQPLYPSIMRSTYFRQAGVWSKDHLAGREMTSLYHQFAQAASLAHINKKAFLDIVKDVIFKELHDEAERTEQEDPTIRFYANKFSSTPKSFSQRVAELTGTTPANAPNDDWIDIFLSYGWSTEGPEGDFGHK